MKRNPLVRFIPARLALLVAPLVAAWPQLSRAANQEFTGAAGATWHTLTNWTGAAGFPGLSLAGVAGVAGEGASGDIASVAAANAAGNVGINMNTMGTQLSLGAIDWTKTNTTATTIGNNSTTASGILLLNGATVNSVPGTILRNAGSANLTVSDRNTGSAAVTMGVQLGITNGIIDVATGRTLTINSSISELNPLSGFTKTGTGTLTVNGANSFSGTLTHSDGVTLLRNSAAPGTGPVLARNEGSPSAADNNNLQVSGGITITNPLTLENAGTANARVSLESTNSLNANANTWAGDITFKSGANQALNANSAPLIINGNILQDASPSTSVFIRGGGTGTINGTINLGTATLVKTDAGTWTISSTGNAMGNVSCADGLLILNNNDALEADTSLNMGQGSATTGRFQINAGFSQKITAITTSGPPAAISSSPNGHSMNGPGSLDVGTTQVPVTIYENTAAVNDVIMNLPVIGTGGFEKKESGTLSFNSTVEGPVQLSAGRIQGSGTYNGGLTVLTGGILGAGLEATAGTVTASSLTLEQDSVLQLNVGSISDLITVTGNTQLNGTVQINPISSGPLLPGTYNLIDYGTNVPPLASFSLGTLPSRAAGSLIDTGTHIALQVTAVDKLVWTGSSGSSWDDFNSSWKLQSAPGAISFLTGDSVIFDDTGTNTDVRLDVLAVSPSAVEFKNTTAVSYSVDGNQPITGAGTVAKTGNGTVTLLSTNTYSGTTSVTDGTLIANFNVGDATTANAKTPIPTASPVTVASPAVLRLVANTAGFGTPHGISGDGTLEINPRIVGGATSALANTFTGTNTGFSGTLRLLTPASGTWRVTNGPAAALGTAKVEVQSGAQFYTANAQTYGNEITITGTGYADANGNLGALRLETSSVWSGNVIVNGTARICSHNTGVANGGTVSGNISGGNLEVNTTNYNNGYVVHFTGTNTYGTTSVGGGNTQTAGVPSLRLNIGKGGTTGTLGTGAVTINGDGANGVLGFLRSDGYTLAPGNTITAAGSNLARTFLDLDCQGAGFANNSVPIDLGTHGVAGGQIRVGIGAPDALATLTGTIESGVLLVGGHNAGLATTNAHAIIATGTSLSATSISVAGGGSTTPLGNTNGARLTFRNGATVTATQNMYAGDGNTSGGTIIQEGGTISVGQQVRVGHWPNETSTYEMNGGTLTLTGAAPTLSPSNSQGGANGTAGDNNINAAATAAIVGGGIYLGNDGTGIFNHTAGTVSTNWIVLDNRGAAPGNASAGEDQYNQTGGRLKLTSGFGIIARHPFSTRVLLDGGTIENAAPAGTAVVIDAPLVLGAAGTSFETGGKSFVLTGSIIGSGNSMTTSGGGKLTLLPNAKTVLDGTSNGTGITAIDANISGDAAVEKMGTGSSSLTGSNTYTGGTTVVEGTLNMEGSVTGTTTVKTGATLGGNGAAGAIVAESGGSVAPGNSVGTLAGTSADLQAGSFYRVEIEGAATADKLNITGTLTANGTIAVTLSGHTPVTGEVFDIADAATIAGTPVFDFSAAVLSGGLSWDTTQFATNGTIRVTGVADPYATWATANGLTGNDALKSADPDGDGALNVIEFATNSDPKAAGSGARVYERIHTFGADSVLTLTVATRKTTAFAAAATTQTAAKDGLTYTVEGTSTLSDWTSATVTELNATDAAAVRAALTLPALDADWEWHTFRTDDTVSTDQRDFIRLRVSAP